MGNRLLRNHQQRQGVLPSSAPFVGRLDGRATDEWLRRRQDLAGSFRLLKSKFEFNWTQVVERRVHSVAVVKSLDVIDYAPCGMFMRFILFLIDLLNFETTIEAVHWRIVIAVAFTAHALFYRVLLKPLSIRQASELRSSIAVDDQSTWWPPEGYGLI
jgi:hypothetical protein